MDGKKTDTKKFAFIMMGSDHDGEEAPVRFEGTRIQAFVYRVRNYGEAKKKVLELKEEGFGAIELCGAFGAERARELIRLTDNQVAIGYVVHEKEQDQLFDQFFGS